MDRKEIKKQNITDLIIALLIIIALNILSSFYFVRVDLTQEKRYTLSHTTRDILKKLPDQVIIKIYLHGDLPVSFKKYEQNIREMLDEFRIYARNKIQYEFIDPYENANEKQVEEVINQLYKAGLQPTNVKIRDKKGGYSEKIIVPGAIASFNNIDFPINLLSNNPGLLGEENLNNSAQNLEYNLINAIKCVTNNKIEKVAFIEGHGEFDEFHTGDMMKELSKYFQVDRGSINGNVNVLEPYKCIIIAGPTQPFSEADKFAIDQYIMKGGKVVWLIDPVSLNRDSFAQGNVFANIAPLNLDDQLFKYGLRINPVLVQDVQCSLIPVTSGMPGNQSKFIPTPWLYFPLLSGSLESPVSKNLNLIKSEFCSYIDTLSIPNIKATPLLKTSRYTRIKTVPCFIRLSEVKQTVPKEEFNHAFLPVAVLLEGKFPSVFQNRLLSAIDIKGNYTFRNLSIPTKMVVIADADIIRNEVRETPNGILISPLGFDKYTSQTYGNKDLLLNAINYLADDQNLIELRARFIELRLLDKNKLNDNLLYWQLINIVLPLLIVGIMGGIIYQIRKCRFER
jgi:gliding-associated putative ABC transporter substrate-binding component GldG